MGASFDASELDKFSRHLALAGQASKRKAVGVVKKAAVNIKKQMQEEASAAGPSGSRLSRTINFDVKVDGGGITAEIGPQEGHAGSLALLYYGNSKTGPVIPDPMGAADAEYPSLKSYLSKLVDL